ncbi:MAG: cardiolipin synthase, partial [Planctomycetales bacterium]|nr:cardiolipin synthase [Planctomycetales bacterium]
ARYSLPTVLGTLRKHGVVSARFIPTALPWRFQYFNLRSHRKLLVVDGRLGFTGGMNIRVGNMIARSPRRPVRDLHFRIEGPATAHLAQVFAVDWAFTTGELLEGPLWFPALAEAGPSLARGIADGPDEEMDHLRLAFMGALSCARRRVRIVTPYFLPEEALIDAMNICAMRGVEVDLVLPQANNLAFMTWAAMASLAPLLERGVRVWMTPGPFDHTKLLIVDDLWVCFGSTNWDARSLRLNFEMNVECYDRQLALQLTQSVEKRIADATPLTLEHVNARSLPVRLRDGLVRLLLPYL